MHAGFIASVGNDDVGSTTEDFPWFILRARQNRPYKSLAVGTHLYWYVPRTNAIVLLTHVVKVEQCKYESVEALREWLITHYGRDPSSDPYFGKAQKCQYCVAFWVRPIREINLPKPAGCNLDRDGWLSCDSEPARFWLAPMSASDPDGHCGGQLRSTADQLVAVGYFDPKGITDERQRRLQEIVQRRGQPEFRAALIEAYQGRCAVTHYNAVSALEAAHIVPYWGPKTNHISNGLLLRADIHTLFDLDLIGIEPQSLRIAVAEQLQGTSYGEISGRSLTVPINAALRASNEALQERWRQFRTDTKTSG